jgi:hypothetical protein
MKNDNMKDQFSRRKFLEASSAAFATGAGSLLVGSATAQELPNLDTQPIRVSHTLFKA